MTQKALLQSAGDGTAVPQGYVGEVRFFIQSAPVNVSTNTNWTNLGSVIVPKGIWEVSGYSLVTQTGSVSFSEGCTIAYSLDSTSGFSDFDASFARTNTIVASMTTATVTQARFAASGTFGVLSVLSDTTYYFKFRNVISSGSVDLIGSKLFFKRIA